MVFIAVPRDLSDALVAFFKMLMQRNVLSVAMAQTDGGACRAVAALLIGVCWVLAAPAAAGQDLAVAEQAAATLAEVRALCDLGGTIAPGTEGNLALEGHVAEKFSNSGFENGEIRFRSPVFEAGKLVLDCGDNGRFELDTMHPSLMRPGNFKHKNFTTRLVYLGHGGVDGLKLAEGISLEGALAVILLPFHRPVD